MGELEHRANIAVLTGLRGLRWMQEFYCSEELCVTVSFRCWELPPSTVGLTNAWRAQEDLLLWNNRCQLLQGRTQEILHPFTAELSLLLLETQITAQCSGKISKWEERAWTGVGKHIEHSLIVAACLFLETSCQMLSLGIHSHKDQCHGNTKQHFVEQ